MPKRNELETYLSTYKPEKEPDAETISAPKGFETIPTVPNVLERLSPGLGRPYSNWFARHFPGPERELPTPQEAASMLMPGALPNVAAITAREAMASLANQKARSALEPYFNLYEKLGVLGPISRLREMQTKILKEHAEKAPVLGYFDPRTKEIAVGKYEPSWIKRGAGKGLSTKEQVATIKHELMHAALEDASRADVAAIIRQMKRQGIDVKNAEDIIKYWNPKAVLNDLSSTSYTRWEKAREAGETLANLAEQLSPEQTDAILSKITRKAGQAGKAIPNIPGLRYNGVQKIPGMPDQYVFTEASTGSTFYSPSLNKADLIAHRDRMIKKFEAAGNLPKTVTTEIAEAVDKHGVEAVRADIARITGDESVADAIIKRLGY